MFICNKTVIWIIDHHSFTFVGAYRSLIRHKYTVVDGFCWIDTHLQSSKVVLQISISWTVIPVRLCTLYYPRVWKLTFHICGGKRVEFRVLNTLHFNEWHCLSNAVNHLRDALYCISTAMWYIRILCNKTVIGHWSPFIHFCGCIPVIDSSQIYCG